MKKIMKRALSLCLSLIMIMSCFSSVVSALPATDTTYTTGGAYGTPAWTGQGDRWFLWGTEGSDSNYLKVYYPSHMYLDISETLQQAGYHMDTEWHFGSSEDYRILLGAPVWGDYRAHTGMPDKYYTMTNIFSNYSVDASVLPNGSKIVYGGTGSDATTFDLRIVGYGHSNQDEDGFNEGDTRHDKYILWRNNDKETDPRKTSIYLMGTPGYTVNAAEFNTSGASLSSYGTAQSWNDGCDAWERHDKASFFQGKGTNSSYKEGDWIEMQWFVTVYDKSALNSAINTASSYLSYSSRYTNESYNALQTAINNAKAVLTKRATTQTEIDNATKAVNDAINALQTTVTLNANGGSINSTSSTSFNQTIGSATTFNYNVSSYTPSRTGYTFKGWATSSTATSGSTSTVSAGFMPTFYAVWEVNKYTVTWLNEDGSTYQTQQVAYGAAIPTIAVPSKAGHTGSWDYAGHTTVPVGGVTIKPIYTINKYTVTWKNDDGTVLETDTDVPYGTTPTYNGDTPTKATDAQYRYTFAGWSPVVSAVTGNVTYTATFTSIPNVHTEIYKNWDGTELKRYTNIPYGQTSTYDGATPTKPADAQYTYTHSGWTSETDDYGNVTYTAQFSTTVNKYTVTWKNDDGTVLETDYNVPYGTVPTYDGDTPTKKATAQYTFEFDNWTTEVVAVEGNVTYTAKYKEIVNNYTVTWENDDGTVLETDKNVPYGTIPTYDGATPTKAATVQYTYTHLGWTPTVSTVTGNVTYTATYTEIVNKYTVTWLNDDGTLLKTDTLEYGATPQYVGATPTKTATAQYTYTFDKWSPAITTVEGNQIYTATYTSTVNEYTVTWKNEDGTVLETDTDVKFGTMPKYDGETPTKASTTEHDYTFEGKWSPAVETVKGDVTYTAQFTETVRKYTITWNIEGKQETTQVEYGTKPVYNGTPTKTATPEYSYTFDKWTPDVVDVIGDAEYTATFTQTPNVYDITWIAEVDGEKQTVATTPVAYGTKLNTLTFPEIPVWEGHTGAWVIEYDTMPANDIEILVKYVSGSVVTWYVDGEMAYKKAFEGGAQIKYPGAEPTKAKDAQYTYTFEGWSVSADSEEIAVKKGESFPIAIINTDLTYYAVFSKTVNTYTVTWVDEDGTTILEKDENVPYGATPSYDKEDPTKEKDAQYTYTFAGWDKPLATVTGDVTFTATYKATVNEYTITWENYDGTELKTESVAYGETPSYVGATPEKAGNAQYSYTHSGWDPEISSVTGDATYTATFTQSVNKYKITWKNDDGSVLLEEDVEYGTVPAYNGTPAKAATAQYTYTFAGWDVTPVAVTGEAIYTATYTSTVNKYIVTWANYNGAVIKTEEVEYGKTPSYVGDTPIKEKDAQFTYTFAGWDKPIVSVTGTVTYTAVYDATVNTYTVTWADEDGTPLETDENVPYGATPSYGGKNPAKESSATTVYTFAGWDKTIATVTGDVTYTATYTESARKYTVFWMVDGEVYESVEVAYGATVPAPTKPLPQKEGHDVSWDKKVTVMPAETVEITAVFTAKKYPVYWSVDGQIKYTAAVSYGSAIPTMIVPEKTGHTGKWVTEYDTMPAKSITIKAEYTPNKYSVLWRIDGVQKTDTATYGTNYVLVIETENIPEELRITIGGIIISEENYTYNSTSGVLTIFGSAITGNINIVSKSTSGSVNVVINIFGGASSNTAEVITTRQTYHTTINPSAGYLRPNAVVVYIDGILLTDGYVYDAASGRLTVNAEIVIGELEIYAECPVDPNYKPSDDNISSDKCSCNCHNNNAFIKFFFDIATFFRKLFGMTQYRYCECGNAHW